LSEVIDQALICLILNNSSVTYIDILASNNPFWVISGIGRRTERASPVQ